MAFLRFMNLLSHELETFLIENLPPYIATSHVWAEDMFPVSRPCDVTCEGFKMISRYLETVQEISRPKYCWMDTWCIDQTSSEDKAHQIPLMGTVYRQAIIVVITLRHRFTFSQRDWDNNSAHELGTAMKYWRSLDRFSQESIAYYTAPETIANLRRGIEMIKEIAHLPWMQRIWTAQEYILAQDDIWVGSDHNPLKIRPQDMMDILQIMCRYELAAPRLKLVEEFDPMITLLQLRLRTLEPTFAIGLAKDRNCAFRSDELYGLMSASGVIIEPLTFSEDVEKAWKIWWESALRKGHIIWAMQATNNLQNCIMPAYRARCDTVLESRMTSPARIDTIEVSEGTVSLLGRYGGRCNVKMFLGSGQRGQAKSFLNRVLMKTGGNFDIMVRVYTAMNIGRSARTELTSKVAWRCARYRWNVANIKPTEEELASMEAQHGKEKPLPILLPYTGYAYLGTITINGTTTDALLWLNGNNPTVQTEELMALDVNARDGNSDLKSKIFMVVTQPRGSRVGDRGPTLHKIGITSPVPVVEFERTDLDQIEDWRRYYVGGKACQVCTESSRIGGGSGNKMEENTSSS